MRETCKQSSLLRKIILGDGGASAQRGITFKRTIRVVAVSCAREWERKGNREDAAKAERAGANSSSVRTAGCRCHATRQNESRASSHWSNLLWHANCALTAPTSLVRRSSSTTAYRALSTLESPKYGQETRDGSHTEQVARNYKVPSRDRISSALLLTSLSVTGKSGPTTSTLTEAAAEA